MGNWRGIIRFLRLNWRWYLFESDFLNHYFLNNLIRHLSISQNLLYHSNGHFSPNLYFFYDFNRNLLFYYHFLNNLYWLLSLYHYVLDNVTIGLVIFYRMGFVRLWFYRWVLLIVNWLVWIVALAYLGWWS